MKNKSLKKNMIYSILLTISNFVFPIITFSYVSRILTPVGIGKIAFVNSILTYFSYIAIIGIPAYGLRECAKVRDDKEKLSKIVIELLIINILSTIMAYILLFLAVLLIPKLSYYKFIFLIMSSSILLNTLGVEWLYKALEEYSYITKRTLIFKIIYIPLVFLLIRNKNDYFWYGFLTIFVTSASYICNFYNLRKYIYVKRINNLNLKKHLKPILILFMSSIIITIYANFDISMIGFIKNEQEVGLYNTALKVKDIILAFSTGITNVFIPRISYYINKKDDEKIKELSTLSFRITMLVTIPIAIFTFIYAKEVVMLLGGINYLNSISTLKILMLCVFCLTMTNFFGIQLLIPLGKEKRFSKSVFAGMFINLLLNFLLIPTYGSFGAAIGTLVTEFWNMIYMGIGVKEYVYHIFNNIKKNIYIVALFGSSFASYLVYIYIKSNNYFFTLTIEGIAFFAFYYIILYLLGEEIINGEAKKVISFFKNRK